MIKTLEVIIPIYNEEECLGELYRRLSGLRTALADSFETTFLFINDGSRDGTLEMLRDLAARDPGTRVIDLSRNFGHQIALSAGLDQSRAEFIAVIDADLQDAPELIAEMLGELHDCDVVYGQRRARKGETWFKKLTASMFYRTLSGLCRVNIPRDTGDFRVMRRKVVRALQQMRETHRFIRGMVPWAGFRAKPFLYDRDERFAGETKYPLRKMIRFAFDAIVSFSPAPLRLATYAGLSLAGLGFLGCVFLLYRKLFTDLAIPGFTTVLVAVLVIGGFQCIFLGLIGEYLARIFEEAKDRPLYFVNEMLGFGGATDAREPRSARAES